MYEIPRAVRFTETEVEWLLPRMGKEGMGSYCLMGCKFQFEKVKFWT